MNTVEECKRQRYKYSPLELPINSKNCSWRKATKLWPTAFVNLNMEIRNYNGASKTKAGMAL